MKKTTFAGIVSLCMVPALFWSTESQAIPSWARKYETSCYMCHSAMPQRNAVGEAFKNNGYRMPAGVEEQFAKQKNVKIGDDEWKKGIHSPVSGSFPQFDPLSVVLTGNLVRYAESTTTYLGAKSKKEELNYNAPNTAALFFGATIGDNISVFGEVLGFGGGTVETDTDIDKDLATTTNINGSVDTQVQCNVRAVYQFSPGFNLALGNNFSNASWNGVSIGGVVNVSGVLPAPGTYVELNYTKGDCGGYSITAGTSMAAKTTTPIVATDNKFDDILYLRGKVKLFGAGLLTAANGEYGNEYNGLDNQVTIGAGLSYSKNNAPGVKDAKTGITPTTGFTSQYTGETLVYGGDIQFVHSNFLAGAAISRDRDLKLNNVKVEAGYFIYPWLFAYSNLADARKINTYDEHQPTIAPAIAWYIAPNVSLTTTYTHFTKERAGDPITGDTNQDTLALAVRAGF
jgi:hypothetical protein